MILSYPSVGLQQWGDIFLEGLSSPVQRQMLGGTQGFFGPLKLQTFKDSLCFHGCWNGFCFIQFWKIPFGSCMGAEAFENLVFHLRCSALLKDQLVFRCFAFIFIQNRIVEKNSQPAQPVKNLPTVQARYRYAKERGIFVWCVLCHEESYRRSPLGGSTSLHLPNFSGSGQPYRWAPRQEKGVGSFC